MKHCGDTGPPFTSPVFPGWGRRLCWTKRGHRLQRRSSPAGISSPRRRRRHFPSWSPWRRSIHDGPRPFRKNCGPPPSSGKTRRLQVVRGCNTTLLAARCKTRVAGPVARTVSLSMLLSSRSNNSKTAAIPLPMAHLPLCTNFGCNVPQKWNGRR